MLISDILTSISCPILIKDPIIRNGTFYKLSNGDYEIYSGGFAVVFPVDVNGEKWAFRCWQNDLGSLGKHFMVLSDELKRTSLPYFCDFTYEDEGIVVNGKIYPTTRMHWIEGLNLKDYLCKYKNDKEKLTALANNFLSMIKDLHIHKISHGDLQHGNILINDQGQIFLIDYDSMFLPKLCGQSDIVHGLAGYQHPQRKSNTKANEKLDYFSELIIYISILAIAHNPRFIEKYKVKDSEELLFNKEDFKDIEKSRIYQELHSIGGIFELLLAILKEYLRKKNINKLESFDVLIERYSKEPRILKFECNQGNILLKDVPVRLLIEVQDASELYINNKALYGRQLSYSFEPHTIGIQTFTLKAVNGLKAISKEISLEIVESPRVSIKCSRDKLRKGKHETAILEWNFTNAMSAQLEYNNNVEDVDLRSYKEISPAETTTYVFHITALDGKSISLEKRTIFVFEESHVEFTSDKEFSFAGIPFVLKWKVTNGKSVKLDGKEVKSEGRQIIEDGIERDTEYILEVEDEFEAKQSKILIRKLPLPTIKSLLVPMPKIEKKEQIINNVPRLKIDIQLNFKEPIIPLMKDNSKYPDLHLEEFKKNELNPIVPLHIDVGTSFRNRLRTALNIITNKVEHLKFEKDEDRR